jgi:diguanylate cyclase (GGDEF)-like protein
VKITKTIGRRPVSAGIAGTVLALTATGVTLSSLDIGSDSALLIALALVFGVLAIVGAWVVAFAIEAGMASELKLLHEALSDPLTGLYNRRSLSATLDSEWNRARRSRDSLSILFIDIDHFKRLNDAHGHEVGDRVLVLVAECIRASIRRSSDLVARYGGEEFAILLPDTTAESANALAEAIRQRVESMQLHHSGSEYECVTVSGGCATCIPRHSSSANALVAAADKQMYAAKAAGRNCVRSVRLRARDSASSVPGTSSGARLAPECRRRDVSSTLVPEGAISRH